MAAHHAAQNWPHNWFGFWRTPAHDYPDVPPTESFVDADWRPPDRDALISYLEQTPIILSATPMTECDICSADVPALAFQSDGVWLWPKSLTHFVREHAVRLPDRLVSHIQTWGYAPRTGRTGSVGDLPWPESWAGLRNLPGLISPARQPARPDE